MPTYEYECNECKHRFEEVQSIKAEPLKVCPECGGESRRLISGGTGFILKGPGFYKTDYAEPRPKIECDCERSDNDTD